MDESSKQFDPWAPVSGILYDTKDEFLIQNLVAKSGLTVEYPPLTERSNTSPRMRIQAYRPAIESAYAALDADQKGVIAQNVVKQFLKRAPERKAEIEEALKDTGWALVNGELRTLDALISEEFFSPGTPYDAYIAIRSILEEAKNSLTVVDPYIGESLLRTVRRIAQRSLHIRFLTLGKNLPQDFSVEVTKFKLQFPTCQLEVRSKDDFHDRFVVVDETGVFHIGASIKDAGRRAFMVSRLEDKGTIDLVRGQIDSTWHGAKPML